MLKVLSTLALALSIFVASASAATWTFEGSITGIEHDGSDISPFNVEFEGELEFDDRLRTFFFAQPITFSTFDINGVPFDAASGTTRFTFFSDRPVGVGPNFPNYINVDSALLSGLNFTFDDPLFSFRMGGKSGQNLLNPIELQLVSASSSTARLSPSDLSGSMTIAYGEVAPVPVPPAALLFGTALLGGAFWRRKLRNQTQERLLTAA